MRDENSGQTLIETALEIWLRRKWLIMICFLFVFGVVAGHVMALPNLYRSSTTLIVGQDGVTESLVENNVSKELELRLGIVRQALMSRGQIQEVIDELNLYEEMRGSVPPASIIERFRQDLDITQEAYAQPQWGQSATYSVTISYQAWDPDLAASVANDFARRFQAEDALSRSGEARRAADIVREQLEGARQKFQEQDQLLTAYRNEHMGNLPEQQGVNLATLARLNSELVLNGERQMQLMDSRENSLASVSTRTATTSGNVIPARLRLERLKQELDQLQEMYTESHPEIIRLEREIATLSMELTENNFGAGTADGGDTQVGVPLELDRDMARLKSEERRLRASISSLTQRIEGIPRTEQELNRRTYNYDVARDEYLALQKRYQDAVLAQSLETDQNQEVKIVEVAIPPDFPAGPMRMRLLFVGMMLAAGFAAGVLLLVEQLNKTFHSTRELRQFTRIPVLASIGNIRTSRDRWIGWARAGLSTVLMAAGLFLVTAASYHLGQGGKQLVLAISG